MNDYKELIEILRDDEFYGKLDFVYDAADAIEQLTKELYTKSSDYETLAKMYAKVNEDLCIRTRERDGAIADLRLVANNCFVDYVFSACCCCKRNDTCNGQPATGCEFEWRGVKEDEASE